MALILPNIEELRSLVANDRTEPTINSKVFPAVPGARFWTPSTHPNNNFAVWNRVFHRASVTLGHRSGSYYVRLVRSVR